MISSGMKRGLAATAVSALAVAGIPALATSASASTGDTISVLSQGPIRNGNAAGGSVILKSSSATIDPANVVVTNADYTNPVAVGAGPQITSPAFNVDVMDFDLLDGDTATAGTQKFADGFYHYEADVAVTLGTATKATFGLVEDTGAAGVDAADAKTLVEVTPTGAPASVDISTAQPATAVGGTVNFAVEVKDAAGNVTQLLSGESFTVSGAGFTYSDSSLDSADLKTGKATVVGTATSGGSKTVTVAGAGTVPATVTDSQAVTVYDNATITPNEFGIATGADTWVDGSTAFGTPTEVRVDQTSVTFNFQGKDDVDNNGVADDAGKVVGLVLSSPTAALKLNGSSANTTPVVVPVLLDSTGKGSATVALSGVTEGASFSFQAPGSGITPATTVTLTRASADSVTPDAAVYVTKVGSPTAVTVTVKDQFGNPIGAPAQVAIVRGARNGSTTTARTTVDATGKATISLPDAGTTAGSEVFSINLYDDQFDASAVNEPGGTINYTVDGLGGDFAVTGATADATQTVINPLYDSNAGAGAVSGDFATIAIAAGTANAPAKVTVDNGALVLASGETNLTQGAASDTITLTGGAGSVKVVGTKAGVVTVTIESGGRTKTVKLTVKPADTATAVASARNIEVTAPEKANAGETAVFEVKVTDAFGNPVAGFSANDLSTIVSGPGQAQTSDDVSGTDGIIRVNVLLSDNASSPVSLRVVGFGSQFGSKVNEVNGTSAPGVTASVATATASVSDITNLKELQDAVDEAQAKVDAAQDRVDDVQGDVAVANAQKSVAQKAVKNAKKALKQAKKKKKGVNAAKKDLADAQGDLKIAKTSVKSAKTVLANAKTRLATAQAELDAAKKALEDAQAEG